MIEPEVQMQAASGRKVRLMGLRALGRSVRAGWALGTVLAVLTVIGAAAPAQAAIGELIVLKGEVNLVRGRTKARIVEKFELEDGDRVVTSKGAKALIRLTGDMQGTEAVVTESTDFQVNALKNARKASPIDLIFGAIRSRVLKYSDPKPFMGTPAAVIGIKGTDFITYVKRKNASEFIGVDGVVKCTSRTNADYTIDIGKRQWGEIVEGQKPNPPIYVPDELWNPAMVEFSFPTPEELRAAEQRVR
jgi:hypothetical protein